MNKDKYQWRGAALCGMFIILVLDTKCAATGVSEGISLCMQTVIPALFPFLLIAPMLTAFLPHLPAFHLLGRLLGIPVGSESIFLTGILCGYPIGAKMIYDAWNQKVLTLAEAKRMLTFSNNAGPAFIFGIGYSVFTERWIPWALWLIHVMSAVLIGWLLPGKTNRQYHSIGTTKPTFRENLENSLAVMAHICGWIIVMRIILAFISKWVLWLFPNWIQVLICGFFELANGCSLLHKIADPSVRFLLMTCFLAFGGLSVHMQTASVTGTINASKRHFGGKLLHCSFSLLLASLLLIAIPIGQHSVFPILLGAIISSLLIIYIFHRKNSSIPAACGV